MTEQVEEILFQDPAELEKIRKQELEMLNNLVSAEGQNAKKYNMRDLYDQFDLIDHPKFGMGFVKEFVGRDKVSVFFEDKERILLMNFKK